jgi:hypothetical protein
VGEWAWSDYASYVCREALVFLFPWGLVSYLSWNDCCDIHGVCLIKGYTVYCNLGTGGGGVS